LTCRPADRSSGSVRGPQTASGASERRLPRPFLAGFAWWLSLETAIFPTPMSRCACFGNRQSCVDVSPWAGFSGLRRLHFMSSCGHVITATRLRSSAGAREFVPVARTGNRQRRRTTARFEGPDPGRRSHPQRWTKASVERKPDVLFGGLQVIHVGLTPRDARLSSDHGDRHRPGLRDADKGASPASVWRLRAADVGLGYAQFPGVTPHVRGAAPTPPLGLGSSSCGGHRSRLARPMLLPCYFELLPERRAPQLDDAIGRFCPLWFTNRRWESCVLHVL